jgi:hypothetical protein
MWNAEYQKKRILSVEERINSRAGMSVFAAIFGYMIHIFVGAFVCTFVLMILMIVEGHTNSPSSK